MTQGFSRPFSPSGRASVVPELPWKFAGDLLLLHFRTDPEALARYLPAPLSPADDSGEAFVWSPRLNCHPASVAPEDMHPSRTYYNVCVLGLPAQMDGKRTMYSAFQWGDRDWLVVLSWFLGACSKLAQIDESGMHPLMAHQGSPATGTFGSTTRRTVSRHGETIVDMSFKPKAAADISALDFYFRNLPLTSMRHIPDLHVPPRGRPVVHDLTHMVMSNVSFGTPVSGDATLRFGDADNEELLPLQPREVLGAYRVPMTFLLEGIRVVHDYLAEEKR